MGVVVVGSWLVDEDTGEILPPEYEVVNSQATTEERMFYLATKRTAHECTDLGELMDVMKATTDMRGVKIQSRLTEMKKESDYRVRTLGMKPMMSMPQYNLLKQLVPLVVFKNIILCKRSTLAKALGTHEKHLARKLKPVGVWVQTHKAKVGYIKLFVHPWVAYKGRAEGITSCYNTYYTADKEQQINFLCTPFYGPPKPYRDVEITDFKPRNKAKQYHDSRNQDFYDSEENFSVGDWWDKPPAEYESIDREMEKAFAEEGMASYEAGYFRE